MFYVNQYKIVDFLCSITFNTDHYKIEGMKVTTIKLMAGQQFPNMIVEKLGGGNVDLAIPSNDYDWRMVIVYRGKHCPLCTKYLLSLNTLLGEFNAIGIDVVAISADSEEKAQVQIQAINPNFDVGYGLSIKQMQTLGLYISNPRSEQETDRPFAEPGLFLINDKNEVQIVDISNAPFARPELSALLMGMKFIRNPENNYPIRGRYA